MNCHGKGPRLRDVLLKAEVELEQGHVAFSRYSTDVQEDTWYAGSIELVKGLNLGGNVILALEMNSKPLPANHGAPVRVTCPGIAGARSGKWLESITVQPTESQNHY